MARDPLEQLLQSADASAPAPAPTLTMDLRARVRRRHERWRRNRRLAVAVVLLPLLALPLFIRPARSPQQVVSRTPPPTSSLPMRQDLARLEIQAALHEQAATHLLAADQRRRAAPPAAAVEASVLADIREQRDRAALVLIYEADEAARRQRNDRALAAYHRLIEIFPTSYWADVARRRLKEMMT